VDVKANGSERFTGQLLIEERVTGKEGEEGGRMKEGRKEGRKVGR